MLDIIDSWWGFFLQDFNQPWLNCQNLKTFAETVHRKGAALGNMLGFINGTVKGTCGPTTNQTIVYNGHKRKYGFKY